MGKFSFRFCFLLPGTFFNWSVFAGKGPGYSWAILFSLVKQKQTKINLKMLEYGPCLNPQQVLLSHHTIRVIKNYQSLIAWVSQKKFSLVFIKAKLWNKQFFCSWCPYSHHFYRAQCRRVRLLKVLGWCPSAP